MASLMRAWLLSCYRSLAEGAGTAVGSKDACDARFHLGIIAQAGLHRNGLTAHLRGDQRAGGVAYVYCYGRRQANAQRMSGKLLRVEHDAHRDALHDLDPIAGSVLRRQQRKCATAAGRQTYQLATIFDAVAVEIGTNFHGLADAHIFELDFLEI